MTFQGECSESVATQMDQFLPFTWLQNSTQNGPHPLDNPHTYPPSEYTNTINTETLRRQEANHLRSRRQVQHRGRQDPGTELAVATTKRHAAGRSGPEGQRMPSGHEPPISVRGIRFRQIPEEHHSSRSCSQAERRDHSPDLRRRTVTDQDGRVHGPSHIHRQLPAIERHGNGDSNH